MFASPSYSKWEMSLINGNGVTFFIDFERVRKNDGYVYFWYLQNYNKINKAGFLSFKFYTQADCKIFRYKLLAFHTHKEPMGKDIGNSSTPTDEWRYASPNTSMEKLLKDVCSR